MPTFTATAIAALMLAQSQIASATGCTNVQSNARLAQEAGFAFPADGWLARAENRKQAVSISIEGARSAEALAQINASARMLSALANSVQRAGNNAWDEAIQRAMGDRLTPSGLDDWHRMRSRLSGKPLRHWCVKNWRFEPVDSPSAELYFLSNGEWVDGHRLFLVKETDWKIKAIEPLR